MSEPTQCGSEHYGLLMLLHSVEATLELNAQTDSTGTAVFSRLSVSMRKNTQEV